MNGKIKLLLEYLKKYENEDIIKSLLIHDYILVTKKGYLPEFLRIETNFNIKEFLNRNKKLIYEKLNINDYKSIFATNVKIALNKEEWVIGNFIFLINLQEQKFFYIDIY